MVPGRARPAVPALDVAQAPADLGGGVAAPALAGAGHLAARHGLRDAVGARVRILGVLVPAAFPVPQLVQRGPLALAPAVVREHLLGGALGGRALRCRGGVQGGDGPESGRGRGGGRVGRALGGGRRAAGELARGGAAEGDDRRGDGAARRGQGQEELRIRVQGCPNPGQRGTFGRREISRSAFTRAHASYQRKCREGSGVRT